MASSNAADDGASSPTNTNEASVDERPAHATEQLSFDTAPNPPNLTEEIKLRVRRKAKKDLVVWLHKVLEDRLKFAEDRIASQDWIIRQLTEIERNLGLADAMQVTMLNGHFCEAEPHDRVCNVMTMHSSLVTFIASIKALLSRLRSSDGSLDVIRKYAAEPVRFGPLLDLVAYDNSQDGGKRRHIEHDKLARAMGIRVAELGARVKRGERIREMISGARQISDVEVYYEGQSLGTIGDATP